MKNILVFVDNANGNIVKSSLEATAYASGMAKNSSGDVYAVTYGNISEDNLRSLGNYGAKKVLHCSKITHVDPLQLANLVNQMANENNCDTVVFSHDYTGKMVAPVAAAKAQAGLVTGAIDYPQANGSFKVKKAVFSGKAFADVEIKTDKKFVTLLPNSISVEKTDQSAEVAPVEGDFGPESVKVKEFKAKGGEGISLTEADIVVSAGRGLKGPENWGMIEELARELGAATACSRPVADMGWRPHHEHVGQTGITIRPNLYIAIGISGAIQHLAGVNGSKVIVVINTDPEAPFFKAADYGIVGDAFKVVPKLIEAVKKFKASQA
ncbi:MAG: electron transfer flavoprotein subunit alpha/FixB family protein [Salibacteraceae bacterium]